MIAENLGNKSTKACIENAEILGIVNIFKERKHSVFWSNCDCLQYDLND